MIEMASGAPPWNGMRPMEILMQVAMKRKTPAIPAGLPHSLAAGLLERCFAHEARPWRRSHGHPIEIQYGPV
jgi:hypothetical protein